MENSNRLFKFIVYGNYSEDNINYLKKDLNRNNNQLIRDIFKILKSVSKDYNGTEYFNTIIYNAIELINIFCNENTFTEEEIEINKKRIKSVRKELLKNINKSKDGKIIELINKLDEIILEKNIGSTDLIAFIKMLIDKQEEINIIKKFINVNKESITKNVELFDYVFNKAINSLKENNGDIYYYITLLKIVYTSKINKNKYLNDLYSIERNKFINEIYYIINGVKRPYDTEEILEKYDILTDLANHTIISPYNRNINNKIFTIDRTKTYLRDDAISIRKDGSNYIVSIHVADAGVEIKYGSETDNNAKNNFKCMYLPRKRISMLSPNIEDKLSLNKNKLRRVISIDVVLNDSGDIIDYDISKNEIVVKENISYTDGDKIINYLSKHDFYKSLNQLYMICKALQYRNKNKSEYWEKKEKANVQNKLKEFKSDVIITELMVLYNRIMAIIANDKGFPFVYRVQETEYITPLLNELGIEINSRIKNIVNGIYLDSKYSTIPNMHAGLGFPLYSHTTDPLRRYPDLYNQYLLHEFYFKDGIKVYNENEFEELVNYFNQRNRDLSLMKAEYTRALEIKR